MTEEEKKKILDQFNKKKEEENKPNISDKRVEDPELKAKILKQNADRKEKSFLSGVGETVTEFFTGTKKTEFAELPEIGEAVLTGKQAAQVGLGLSITPNMKSQIDIIRAAVPGSNVMEDKFGNPIIVMPDGQSFYLNKPGASFQDFAQTTSQILMYIPGYSTIAKKYAQNIIKRSLAQTAQAGAVTSAQEGAAALLGADVDLARVGIASGITFGFEAILGPVGRTVIKMFKSNPNYYKLTTETLKDGTKKRKVEVTKAGYKALEAAGVDTKKMSPEFAENFFNNIVKGLDDEVAAVSGKFGIDLSTSQAKRNEEGIAALYEAAKGAFGKETQQEALAFLRKQEIQVGTGLKELIKKFNKGELAEETLEDIGDSLATSVKNSATKKSEAVESAYNLIDKDAVFNGNESNVKVLLNSVKKVLKDQSQQPYSFIRAINESTGILDKDLAPAALKSFNEIKKFVNSFKKKKKQKKAPVKTFKDFDIMRKKLDAYIGAAKNNTDKTTAIAIKKEFDKLFDDTLDNLLFAGKEGEAVLKSNIKEARKLYKEKAELFGVNVKKGAIKIGDPAGVAIQKILIDPDVTGMKTINYIFGLGTVGRKETGDQIIKRLKTIFGVDKAPTNRAAALISKDFAKLRSGMIEKMFNDSIKNGRLNTNTLVNNFDFIFNKNPDIAKSLFGTQEIKVLKEFVEEVRKTLKPKDLVNPSNTAAGIARIFERGGRQFIGLVGLKLAGINGLLFGRSVYDATKDVFEQKAAKKLISKEFGEGPPGWLQNMNRTTGTGKQLATTVALVDQAYGQTIPKMTIDAQKASPRIMSDLERIAEKNKPPQMDIEGIKIPGTGINITGVPPIFRRMIGDQSSLPVTPNVNQSMLAQAPSGIMQNLSSTEQALLDPMEQVIARRT